MALGRLWLQVLMGRAGRRALQDTGPVDVEHVGCGQQQKRRSVFIHPLRLWDMWRGNREVLLTFLIGINPCLR